MSDNTDCNILCAGAQMCEKQPKTGLFLIKSPVLGKSALIKTAFCDIIYKYLTIFAECVLWKVYLWYLSYTCCLCF